MKRPGLMMFAAGLLCVSAAAQSAEEGGYAMTKRQRSAWVSHCMVKRMSVDHRIFYNSALQGCRAAVAQHEGSRVLLRRGTLVAGR